MVELDSSNIKAAGVDLIVEFHQGAVYRYRNVPVDVVTAFYEAESHGKFLNQAIKPFYEVERVS